MGFNTEKQQKAREILNREILDYSLGQRNILLELPTGSGKTGMALSIIKMYGSAGDRGLVLVPEIPLIDNFKEDAKKLGYGGIVEGWDIACYASASKYVGREYDWVILDECHRSKSDLRVAHLQDIYTKRRIALSATIDKEVEEALENIAEFAKFSVSLQEAFDRGLIPEPEIRVCYVDLDNEVKRNEYMFGKKKVLLTDQEYYNTLCKNITYWKERYEHEGKKYQKLKMLGVGGDRKRFLALCKTQKTLELLEEVKGERTIVFTGSVHQSEIIQDDYSKVVSSKHNKKSNQLTIQDFNDGKFDTIIAKDMLKEGMNLKNCRYGIIVQLGNKERDAVQQIGRILRHDDPVVYVILVRDTVDDRFFNSSFGKLNDKLFNYEY